MECLPLCAFLQVERRIPDLEGGAAGQAIELQTAEYHVVEVGDRLFATRGAGEMHRTNR